MTRSGRCGVAPAPRHASRRPRKRAAPWLRRGASAGLALLLGALPSAVRAEVHRFALLVGNDRGIEGDTPLRYAQSDAAKVGDVLRSLGGFRPENVALLQGEPSEAFRSTLISLNARIRELQGREGNEALLLVYYSGHADAQSLRMAGSQLPLRQLSELVTGSAATFRLLVVDACRSGALTRRKGGTVVAPFPLAMDERLPGQGVAVLTASAETEDAQESDELSGSFFTHAFVSGLLGAADSDGDGEIVLEEAYRHARDATVRATSRTFAGTQHPTFRYDVRGQDSLVLTRPGRAAARSHLVFPEGLGFLVLAESGEGPVVGEVEPHGRGRELSLRPGRYFLRGRGEGYLLEGALALAPGQSQAIDPSALDRVQYARLVRKGAGEHAAAHSAVLAVAARSRLINASTPCYGLAAGYQLDLPTASLFAEAGACRSRLEAPALTATADELRLSAGAARSWDAAGLSLSTGAHLGAALFRQNFDFDGKAPARTSLSPFAALRLAARYQLPAGLFVAAHADGEAHLLPYQQSARADARSEAQLAVRLQLGAGTYF